MESPWTRDGRVRAEIVNISPYVSGIINLMSVQDNAHVKKGDLLLKIDDNQYQLAVATAEANLANAEVAMMESRLEAHRREKLNISAISKEEKQKYVAEQHSTEMQFKAAKSALEKAQLDLKRTAIYSPVNGYITNLSEHTGNYITTGQPTLTIVNTQSMYIYGYFLETQLSHIHRGDKATISLLSDKNKPIQGEVESIARGITDYSNKTDNDGLHAVNPTFDWVRLAQRIPVRIKITEKPDDLLLVAGMTCTIVLKKR